jgi:maleate isomerase
VNSVVQPEYDAMRPAGVTNHIVRIEMPNMRDWDSVDDQEQMLREVDANIVGAVDQALQTEPDHLILGVSIESIWDGGLAACEALRSRIETRAGNGIEVTQCPEAFAAAFAAYGVEGAIAIVHPYFSAAEPHLRGYMDEIGRPVARLARLESARANGLAEIGAEEIIAALRDIDGDDVAAIVQFGANLPMMRMAAEAERWLHKPVIAVNTATYWHALRRNGITDVVEGCGRLLERF